ncbi:MAG: di-heme oxidoredictase family protein [Tabrizicola flagellatus]|uniref:di-heme oxidoredictase family protein n=1 Tax=Tabrizicola flagellatus TaxID=2593021 RepID=UPI00391876C8
MRALAVTVAALAAGVALAQSALPEADRIVPARLDRAFSMTAAAPTGLAALDAQAGSALFDRLWVAAPASTRAADGLGPLYNARACSACHVDHGRAHPPVDDGALPPGLVVRLAQPDGSPDPVYGHQVQPFATAGLPGEARAAVRWHETVVQLADGTPVALRRPEVVLSDLASGPLDPATRIGLRAAPPLVGLGLIAAIDPADLSDPAAPGSARMARPLDGGAAEAGRFGRRAGAATLHDSIALALSADMGLSSPSRPEPWGDCTPAQSACRAAPHGDGDAREHELAQVAVDLIAAHLASLAPPARRDPDRPAVQRGEALFHDAGCAICHRPSFTIATAEGPRVIRPYSDFRLHDMGEGLADPAPEAGVAPGEWRTTPLWGLGYTRTVGVGRESYLHDGRARDLLEAILWHGGDAASARNRVAGMDAADRAALIAFLESL